MPRRHSPELALFLLGEFCVRFDEEEVRLATPARRLLAYLAVVRRDRPLERGLLAEHLWPEASAGKALGSLRSLLWRLPRPRGRTLVTCTAGDVRLSPGLVVDLWEAEQLAADLLAGTAAPPADATAVRPLTRDLLPSWPDDWLLVEREAWRQQRLHALEQCAAAYCSRGWFTEALRAGLGAVGSDPLRESAHRRVIEVHLAEGNHAEALRQYDGYRRLLAEEVGLSPSPAIRRLVAPLLGRPVEGM